MPRPCDGCHTWSCCITCGDETWCGNKRHRTHSSFSQRHPGLKSPSDRALYKHVMVVRSARVQSSGTPTVTAGRSPDVTVKRRSNSGVIHASFSNRADLGGAQPSRPQPSLYRTYRRQLLFPALRVGYALPNVADHFLGLRFRSLSWPRQGDFGPFRDERSRISSYAGNTT
jgi:hypothetical protein